jgi:hypothetical protein
MLVPLLLVLALAVFLAVWLLLNTSPNKSAALIIRAAPLVLVALGVALTLLGRGMVGVPLALLGLSWRRRMATAARTGGPTPAASGRKSTVRTASLEMELDHDSGEINGQVLAGSFSGRQLFQLTEMELLALYRELATDAESVALLASYLDRRFSGWREKSDSHAAHGGEGGGGFAAMNREEAYQILGLSPGASAEEVHQAWRRLMKKVHPDSGGSAYLAAKINAAKDLLLG